MQISNDQLINLISQQFEGYEKQLNDLQTELKIINKKLEEAETLKSHFVSNVTNEIMNPFSSILALSKSILSVDKESWKQVISMIALIHSEAFALDFQLKNIFAAAKIEAGEIVPQMSEINIPNLLKGLKDHYKFECNKKKLKINIQIDDELKTDPVFKTDYEKLELIISNLLSNAINFSFHNRSIDLVARKEGKKLFITVRDYGTGISEENQKIIFDRFNKVDTGINSINRGHGLGLSVNKAFLDFLDGDINIESKENEGSTFTVYLPELNTPSVGFAFDDNEFLFDDGESF
jgi:signal transduction histidine kinase